jgi:hypothetical protein
MLRHWFQDHSKRSAVMMPRVAVLPLIYAALASLSLSHAPAFASAPGDDEPIVVTGQRMTRGEAHQMARTYTRAVFAVPEADQNARWAEPICIGAIGLRAEIATSLIDRIEATARKVGARVAQGDCAPNVIIAFLKDSDATFANLQNKRPDLLVSTKDEELRKLSRPGWPVRWFYGQVVEGLGGRGVGQNAPGLAGSPDALFDLPVLNDGTSTRIGSPAQVSIKGVTVLVDVPRIGGVPFDALADNLAFGILSRTRIDADPRSASIMALFTAPEGSRPTGLSDFDVAMLKALYKIPINRSAAVHRNQIASEMIKDIGTTQ